MRGLASENEMQGKAALGYSLVELLVAMALVVGAILAFATFSRNQTQTKETLSLSEQSLANLILPLEKLRSDLRVARRIYKDPANAYSKTSGKRQST